jgi:hypothetical protein
MKRLSVLLDSSRTLPSVSKPKLDRLSPVLHLPEDVISVILDFRYPDIPYHSPWFTSYDGYRSDQNDKAYVALLCLISRAWLVPARRVLYRTITEYYNNVTHAPLLWDTITNFPHIRPLIRRMYLRNGVAYPLFADLNLLLPSCAVLVSIPGYWVRDLQAFASSESIGYLHAQKDPKNTYTEEVWRCGFKLWIRLEVLEFTDYSESFPYDDVTAGSEEANRILPSLTVLKFKWLEGRLPIPPTTRNTLHTLSLLGCRRVNGHSFLHLLRHHADSLRRIHMRILVYREDVLPHLSRLEELIIIQCTGWTTSLFSCLTTSLINLTLSENPPPNNGQLSPGACKAYLQDREFRPNLKKLGMSLMYGYPYQLLDLGWFEVMGRSGWGVEVSLERFPPSMHQLPLWAQS